MVNMTYRMGLPSGDYLDVQAYTAALAVDAARILAGEPWLHAKQVTRGSFAVDLGRAQTYAELAVDGVIKFVPSATQHSAYRYTLMTVVADGVNAPTFEGFSPWGGSLDWNNTAGVINHLMFFSDGLKAYYSIVSPRAES